MSYTIEQIINKSLKLYKEKKYKKSLQNYLIAYKLSKKKNDKKNEVVCLKKIFSLSNINRLSQEFLPLQEEPWIINYKKIELGDTINSGAYSIVKKGSLNIEKEKIICAIKEIDMKRTSKEDFIHEVKLMYECNHKNILKIFGCFWRRIPYKGFKNSINYIKIGNIVMELCEKGCLLNMLKQPLTNIQKFNYIYQIAEGMHYVHSKKNIVHRDLKLDNILVDSNDVIKICDFGVSKHLKTFDNSFCGTPEYVAPEILLLNNTNPKLLDVYSFGILTWAIWAQESPFKELQGRDFCKPIVKMTYIIKYNKRPSLKKLEEAPLKLKNLIKSCWAKTPKKRPPSFKRILEVLDEIKLSLKDKNIKKKRIKSLGNILSLFNKFKI